MLWGSGGGGSNVRQGVWARGKSGGGKCGGAK